MTAPESQPLTEEERAAIAEGLLIALVPMIALGRKPSLADAEALLRPIEGIIATRTAALLDRLKAAEGERDDYRLRYEAEQRMHRSSELIRKAEANRADRAEAARAALASAEADKARAVAEARMALLDEVEQWIVSSAPRVGFELRYDGTEDPTAAAYVQGFREAWETVRALRKEVAQ